MDNSASKHASNFARDQVFETEFSGVSLLGDILAFDWSSRLRSAFLHQHCLFECPHTSPAATTIASISSSSAERCAMRKAEVTLTHYQT